MPPSLGRTQGSNILGSPTPTYLHSYPPHSGPPSANRNLISHSPDQNPPTSCQEIPLCPFAGFPPISSHLLPSLPPQGSLFSPHPAAQESLPSSSPGFHQDMNLLYHLPSSKANPPSPSPSGRGFPHSHPLLSFPIIPHCSYVLASPSGQLLPPQHCRTRANSVHLPVSSSHFSILSPSPLSSGCHSQ